MRKYMLITCISHFLEIVTCINSTSSNSSDTNKDMYVIHAMVYQVGIITNKTDDKALNATMGNQEALTFFHTNGSNVDLSSIPTPLVTNVTAQSVIQVAPKGLGQETQKPQISWSDLKDLASLPQSSSAIKSENGQQRIVRRSNYNEADNMELYDDTPLEVAYKRSVGELGVPSEKEALGNKASVKVMKGAAVIPQAAGVRSIAIPPLLTLNHNLSDIPVPIPNTSVVHYAKINTLIRQP